MRLFFWVCAAMAFIVLWALGAGSISDDCQRKCGPRGGVVVTDYVGLPQCLCQGGP